MKSIKLAKITAVDLDLTKTSKAGKPYGVAHLEYTQPLEPNPTETKSVDIAHFKLKENPTMGAALKTINVGDEIGIEKTQNGSFWPVTGFVDKADVPPPKPAYNGGGGYKKSFDNTPKDTAGVKVGAVMHDSIAMAIAQKKELVTVSDVVAVARQLLTESFILEEEVRAGGFKGSTTPEVGIKKETLPTTPAEAVATLDTKIDSLDSNTKMGSLPF